MKLSFVKNQIIINSTDSSVGLNIRSCINKQTGLSSNDYYLLFNGKIVEDQTIIGKGQINVVLRCLGGKGGFGSMLRAIGAQIEKTTNREACRDLSGRRLRDINEEQRLKNWINQQAEREKEAKEKKQKKLERLCERPKHEFKDEQYDRDRSELPEKVENALIQGLQASGSSKRKITKPETGKKKKPKLWVDDELDDLSSGSENDDSDTEDSQMKLQQKSSTESENSQSSHASNEPHCSVQPFNPEESQSAVPYNEDLSRNLEENKNKSKELNTYTEDNGDFTSVKFLNESEDLSRNLEDNKNKSTELNTYTEDKGDSTSVIFLNESEESKTDNSILLERKVCTESSN